MADLAAPMNMKRKDVEVVASHGFSIFLDPKRIKLQDGGFVDMMEEDERLGHAPTATATAATIVARSNSSEPPSRFDKDQDTVAAAPMDMEADAQQQQHQHQHQRLPCQNAPFFSGFF